MRGKGGARAGAHFRGEPPGETSRKARAAKPKDLKPQGWKKHVAPLPSGPLYAVVTKKKK